MINHRLFQHYGIDTTKHLGLDKMCPRPFDTVLVDKNGSCFACECTAWLPQSIGNLQVSSLSDILDSGMAREIRNSIEDGSYRYCNDRQCMYLMDLSRVGWSADRPATRLREIRLAVDDSCNLACPSCRLDKIFLKGGRSLTRRMLLIDKIIDYIGKCSGQLNIHIGSDGDPFASLIYRYFMRQVPDLPNLSYTLQTNGLLIKQMYHRVTHIFNNLKTLNISIDGATEQTYEKLRRGGRWSKMKENLKFVTELKSKHGFDLHLHMVVQRDNWREMPLMLELAESHNVDRVYYNPIQDWSVSNKFEEIKVPEHLDEFRSVLAVVKKSPIANAW